MRGKFVQKVLDNSLNVGTSVQSEPICKSESRGKTLRDDGSDADASALGGDGGRGFGV